MCPKSLDILERSVFLGVKPDFTDDDLEKLVTKITAAARLWPEEEIIKK